MGLVKSYLRDLARGAWQGWDRFWFTPSDPATLGLIRILAGLMLFYTHLVWALDLEAFFGPRAWVSPAAADTMRGSFEWTYLWWLPWPGALWTAHVAALVVFACLALGLFTRAASILSFLIVVAYAHRQPGAMFGLDQISALLAMYLMVGPSGAAYSLDRLWARWRAGAAVPSAPSAGANIAIRLIQLHMCIIYLFAGLSKLKGDTWWNGTAMWYAFANMEYQSLDMTWMVHYLLLVNVMTHVTVAWEISYSVLVWPRLTRPLVIALAVPLHLGIVLCLGMATFGLVMLIANLAFVSPALVRAVLERRRPEQGRAGEAPPDPAAATVETAAPARSKRRGKSRR